MPDVPGGHSSQARNCFPALPWHRAPSGAVPPAGAAGQPAGPAVRLRPGVLPGPQDAERCCNPLKQFRAVVTRFQKREVYDRAVVVIASLLLWLDG